MGIIQAINHYLDIIMFVSIITAALIFGILYYLLKIKKVTAKTEKIDYSSFARTDSKEYVKFENVIAEEPEDLKSPGMIALGNNSFVAGINVFGYNYASASSGEQQRTMVNAIGFSNRIIGPIQMRQTVKAVDLSHNIEVHETIIHNIALQMEELSMEYDETVTKADDYLDEEDIYASYEERIQELQRLIIAKRHEFEETQALLRYMNAMSSQDKSTNAQKINQIMFTYTFDPSEYTEELSKEEIYNKAFTSLSTQANSYGEGVLNCGCTYRRLSASDLIELMRNHMQPLSCNEIKLEDLFNSSYTSLFISSESLVDYEIKKRGEEAFMLQLSQYQNKQESIAKEQREEAKELERMVMIDTKNIADQIEEERAS